MQLVIWKGNYNPGVLENSGNEITRNANAKREPIKTTSETRQPEMCEYPRTPRVKDRCGVGIANHTHVLVTSKTGELVAIEVSFSFRSSPHVHSPFPHSSDICFDFTRTLNAKNRTAFSTLLARRLISLKRKDRSYF